MRGGLSLDGSEKIQGKPDEVLREETVWRAGTSTAARLVTSHRFWAWRRSRVNRVRWGGQLAVSSGHGV